MSALEQLAMAAIGRESRFYGDLSKAFADIGDVARPIATRPNGTMGAGLDSSPRKAGLDDGGLDGNGLVDNGDSEREWS